MKENDEIIAIIVSSIKTAKTKNPKSKWGVRMKNNMTEDLNKTTTSIDKLNKEIVNRKQVEEMLRSERDKFQAVLDAVGEGMYIVNHDFTIQYQNEVLSKKFGDNKGGKCYKIFFQSNEPCKFCLMREVIESGKPQDIEVSLLISESVI